jgi:nucleotide-binding universal stress UspA family protein
MVRFKRILCPVDFHGASTAAFDYAARLAVQYGAKLHVLHVVAPVMPAPYGIPFSVAEYTADLEKESKRFLQKFASRAAKARIDVRTEVRIGDVDSEILRTTHGQKVDLVVMGSHGRRGFERLVLGSVTERMVRHCPVPLLTVGLGKKRAAPPNIRRILLTTDFSDGTADAVAHAFSIAKECRAKVTLLHVVHDIAADPVGKYREPLLRGIENHLQELIPPQVHKWCEVETRVEEGLAFRVIPQVVQSGPFDLLIMNIHGKSLLERALIGSTAERTLRAAAGICPVLLIPPLRKSKSKRPRKKVMKTA